MSLGCIHDEVQSEPGSWLVVGMIGSAVHHVHGGVIACHIHPAYSMGSQASRDALQVRLDGLQVRHRAAGPSGRQSDDAATYGQTQQV